VARLTGKSAWLRRPAGHADAGVRLFCFHHAGGSAAVFREWPRLMPAVIEPVAVQLPGRADRFTETPFDSMPELVAALTGELAPLLGQPFAFYGLSMGAKIAWALAHRFRDLALPAPSALYLASTASPGLDGQHPFRWQDDIVGYLRLMGGTPPEVFDQPEFLDSMLPMVRADLTLVDSFRFRPAVPLDMPIHAFAGAQDAEGGPERMSGWRSETRGRFDLDVVKGGHFFDPAGELRVIRTVAAELVMGIGSHEDGRCQA
jgi:medium-chain acyl-[acyl-carrier-protein] hydrolase